MAANHEDLKKRIQMEKLTDSVNMGAVNFKLRAEKKAQLENRRKEM